MQNFEKIMKLSVKSLLIDHIPPKLDKMKPIKTRDLASAVPLMIIFCLFTVNFLQLQAQVVSHELRRLAVSTNQFGIDALKALDKIEPPDKVLVFCPVCISSSLMMIMMGSSKYPVVAALRHALYVWSMKPQEINRGYQDIFEHIGLNQQQQTLKIQPALTGLTARAKNRRFIKRSQRFEDEELDELLNLTQAITKRRPTRSVLNEPQESSQYLSLPKLMRIREFMETSAQATPNPWWTQSSRKPESGSRELKETSNTTRQVEGPKNTSKNLTTSTNDHVNNAQRFMGDLSQMSAISNIYVQRGLTMNYNYNLLLREFYKTVIHPVDFIRNGEETRQHINSLVAANTEGKIKDLVKKGSFQNPKIMIISTFHFRGTLDIQMKRSDTHTRRENGLRHLKANRTARNIDQPKRPNQNQPLIKAQVFIETEETLLKHGSFANLDCSMIEIPFNNRLVSLVVVMPNHVNSTELLLTKLSAQVLSDMINSLSVKKISVEIPVIKFDRGPVNVEGILKELGLDSYFFGDKIYSTETGLNRWMRPGDIMHETSIDIGTINPKWSQTEDRLKAGAHENRAQKGKSTTENHIKLDKPFFYFVLDSINGLILTVGRIRQ